MLIKIGLFLIFFPAVVLIFGVLAFLYGEMWKRAKLEFLIFASFFIGWALILVGISLK